VRWWIDQQCRWPTARRSNGLTQKQLLQLFLQAQAADVSRLDYIPATITLACSFVPVNKPSKGSFCPAPIPIGPPCRQNKAVSRLAELTHRPLEHTLNSSKSCRPTGGLFSSAPKAPCYFVSQGSAAGCSAQQDAFYLHQEGSGLCHADSCLW
jgi:hypothetical protein